LKPLLTDFTAEYSISIERVWSQIHSTADWGRLTDNPKGVSRLALTDEDRCVRDWFQDEARRLGCEVRVDKMGNIFVILPGESKDIAPIGMGSHLDTQPRGTPSLDFDCSKRDSLIL